MNCQNLYDDINFLVGTTATNYSATDKLANLNRWYKALFSKVLQATGTWDFQETSATATLAANTQKNYIGTAPLTMKRVEVNYDIATDATGWKLALPLDRSEVNFTDITLSADLAKSFNAGKPYYDMTEYNGSAYIDLYPVPFSASTGGLKFWYNADLTLFTGSADIPVLAEPFHRLLSLGAAYDWAFSRNMREAQNLKLEYNELLAECVRYYATRDKDRVPAFLRGVDDSELD